MSWLSVLEQEARRVGADLATLTGKKPPIAGLPRTPPVPATTAMEGGLPPFQAIQNARKARLTLSMNTSFVPPVLPVVFDTTDPTSFGGLAGANGGGGILTIPNGWEGGGLILSAFLDLSGMVADDIADLIIVKHGSEARVLAEQTLYQRVNGNEVYFSLFAMDPNPKVGDNYKVNLTTSTNPILIASDSTFQARQIFPL